MNDPRRSRFLGLFWLGAFASVGGLAGLVRASWFGATQWRVIIACASLMIGIACTLASLRLRRRAS